MFDGKRALGSGQFDNTEAGCKKLSKWLRNKGVGQVWVCLEATGRYGEQLAEYFFEAGYQVSVVNPARIRKYADSQLRRNKTDRLDAVVIADFCRTQEPPLWAPPTPQKRDLQEMSRRLEGLIEQRTRETNRLKSGQECEAVVESLYDSLAFLDEQITKLEARIREHIDRHPDLKEEFNPMPHLRGTVSMARAATDDSANSQFFIVFYPRFSLDKKYTNFGRVIAGMDAVDEIQRGEPPANPTRILQASIAADNKPQRFAPVPAPEETISLDDLNAPISQ